MDVRVHKEGWASKNWSLWTVVLEKTLESPWYCKEIQPVHPKGDQSWIFTGRTDAEAPILWPPDAKSWLIRKDPDAGKDGRGGEGDDRGWDGWMASPTQWTRVWAGSRSWQRRGKPGALQSMGSQGVGHDWATRLNWALLTDGAHRRFGHRQKRTEKCGRRARRTRLAPARPLCQGGRQEALSTAQDVTCVSYLLTLVNIQSTKSSNLQSEIFWHIFYHLNNKFFL